MVAHGTPCLGPVTHAGCGALCPRYGRGCYGCFGPADTANTASLVAALGTIGVDEADMVRLFRTFNADAQPFRAVSTASEIAVAAPRRKP
jgi:coenzyme F420-reducing hydrogenase gamma subunit